MWILCYTLHSVAWNNNDLFSGCTAWKLAGVTLLMCAPCGYSLTDASLFLCALIRVENPQPYKALKLSLSSKRESCIWKSKHITKEPGETQCPKGRKNPAAKVNSLNTLTQREKGPAPGISLQMSITGASREPCGLWHLKVTSPRKSQRSNEWHVKLH